MVNVYGKLLADIMYKDTCTILRQQATTDDIGADVFAVVDVYIVKINHQGQTFIMRCDSPFKYTTHQEITLIRDDEA